MRDLSSDLIASQRTNYTPALKINVGDYEFTLDEFSTCSNVNEVNPDWTSIPGGRILKAEHLEEPWRGGATILLNNHDRLMNAIDLTGETLSLSWGADGIYSKCAPLRVKDQTLPSGEGSLTCTLECTGIMGDLGDDKAQESYAATEVWGDNPPDWEIALTVKQLLYFILQPQWMEEHWTGNGGSPLTAAFGHCDDYRLEFDSEDNLIDSVVPGGSFKIEVNESRLQVISRLMALTYCVMKPGCEDLDSDGRRTLHIFMPKTSGAFDYECSITRGDDNFITNAHRLSLVTPNDIIVKTPVDVTPAYEGYAKDTASANNYKIIPHTEYISGLVSNAEAGEVAQAILSTVQSKRKTAGTTAYMHAGLELYDWVNINDSTRADNSVKGNVGVINRVWDSTVKGRGRYYMDFSFGGWLEVQKLPDRFFGGEERVIGETKTAVWCVAGELETGVNKYIFAVPVVSGMTGLYAQAQADTGPTGADLVIDLMYDGVTVFTDQDNRLKIVAGQTQGNTSSIDIVDYEFDHLLTMEIDQVGSDTAGNTLVVQFTSEVK